MTPPLQSYYSRIYKTYDLVNRLFTFGLDRKWRRHTVDACLQNKPQKVLDLCCGTGDLAVSINRSAGNAIQVTGFDLNSEMLGIARQKAARYGINGIDFIPGNAGSLPFSDNEFDCITIGFGFRNLTFENPEKDQYISEISRVMKPGAILLILESARPDNKMIGFFYRLYLKLFLVPLGGLLSGDWKAYRYLADSSAGFYTYSDIYLMLNEHQLHLYDQKKFLFGTVNLLFVSKKGS